MVSRLIGEATADGAAGLAFAFATGVGASFRKGRCFAASLSVGLAANIAVINHSQTRLKKRFDNADWRLKAAMVFRRIFWLNWERIVKKSYNE